MPKKVITFRATVEIEVYDATDYVPILDAMAGALLGEVVPGDGHIFEVSSQVRGRHIPPFVAEGRARIVVDKGLFEIAEGSLPDVDPERP